jgi:hypothetical protein
MTCFAVGAGVVLSTSCGGTRATLPAPITFGKGVAGVYLFMSPAQVEAAWKLELHLVASSEGSTPVLDASVCVGKMHAALHFYGFFLLSIWFIGEARTDKGVGIGSSVEELRRAYGTRLNSFYEVVEQGPPPRAEIGFAVRDGRVHAVGYGTRYSGLSYHQPPSCQSELRTHLENVFQSVNSAFTIGDVLARFYNKQAVEELASLQKSLNSEADDLKAHGAKSEAVDDLHGAATLDGEAAKEDLATKAGRDKARRYNAAAIKLMKQALPLIHQLVLATPRLGLAFGSCADCG